MEKGLSSYYVRICHEAYQKNIITAQRLAEILLIEENELTIEEINLVDTIFF